MGPVRPQREHLPGVRVGGARLGVQVVAVVPDHDEAEPCHGGEHRGPGASHHADLAAGHGQPPAVPLGWPEARRQADVPPGAEHPGQPGVDQAQVPCVRDHDERAAPEFLVHRHPVSAQDLAVNPAAALPDPSR